MKNYRVKVREDKVVFFEELMRYLDFADYEMVEGFSEARIYSSFEITPKSKKVMGESKNSEKDKLKPQFDPNSGFANIREVMSKIEAQREKTNAKKS
jgi:hypothetical protein